MLVSEFFGRETWDGLRVTLEVPTPFFDVVPVIVIYKIALDVDGSSPVAESCIV